MNQSPESTTTSGTGTATPVVTVRYWAAARAAAGRVEDQLSGDSVAEVIEAALVLHAGNPRFRQVLSASSLLLGDKPLGARDPALVAVSHGDTIEVLPPFAGG